MMDALKVFAASVVLVALFVGIIIGAVFLAIWLWTSIGWWGMAIAFILAVALFNTMFTMMTGGIW